MNYKVFTALFLSISSINSLSAASLIKNITHQKSLNTKAQQTESNPFYTDFTGNWRSAKCMGNEITLEIENTEEYLSLGGEEMTIGSMTTKSNSGIRGLLSTTANSDIESIEWNADKTQLIMKTINVNKNFAEQSTQDIPTDTSMHLYMNYATLELDNEQLRLKINSAEYKDLQRIDTSQQTCIFVKNEE